MTDRLRDHREVWNRKKILRAAYLPWYQDILRDRSTVRGATVELGGGGGTFKEFAPEVVMSDISFLPWLDVCCDAGLLPFKPSSVANFVMVDVLHHLSDPVGFLHEAWSRLARGGRILMVEPYPSAFSAVVYRLVHPEPFLYHVDYFNSTSVHLKDPWDSNQAIPYLLFFRQRRRFEAAFGMQYRVVRRKLMSTALYPASGGFERPSLVPDMLIPALNVVEWLLTPLNRLLAFRCYVVLEKY